MAAIWHLSVVFNLNLTSVSFILAYVVADEMAYSEHHLMPCHWLRLIDGQMDKSSSSSSSSSFSNNNGRKSPDFFLWLVGSHMAATPRRKRNDLQMIETKCSSHVLMCVFVCLCVCVFVCLMCIFSFLSFFSDLHRNIRHSTTRGD